MVRRVQDSMAVAALATCLGLSACTFTADRSPAMANASSVESATNRTPRSDAPLIAAKSLLPAGPAEQTLDAACSSVFDIKSKPKPQVKVCVGGPADVCDSRVVVKVNNMTGKCTAEWELDAIVVWKHQTPTLTWSLVDKDGNPIADYKFDDKIGIGLCPKSHNYLRRDLTDGKCVGEACNAFQWTAVNRWRRDGIDVPADEFDNRTAIHFGMVVVDKSGNYCESIDPMIVNLGP